MKQIFQKFCIILAMLGLSTTMYAYDFEVDGIYYNKLSDGNSVEVTYKNTNYNSYSGSVTIPSQVTYSGTTYSVTSIGEYAFEGCTDLTSVTIPNSVTSIGYWAFAYCRGLTSVHISDIASWCKIKIDTFDCNPLCYAHHLYLNDTEITDLEIPNSVTSICKYAFFGCSGLTSVTIPNSVTSIGHDAFSECTGLTSVTIGNSVTSIGAFAFSGCSGLVKSAYPDNLSNPFSSGVAVAYPSDGVIDSDGTIYNKDKTSLFFVPYDVAEFDIPSTVTTIRSKIRKM